MSKAENNVEIFLKNVGEFLYVKVKTPWEAQDCRSPRRNAITEICEADEEDNCLKIQIDKKNMKVKGGGRIYELENQEHYDKINKLLEKENLVFFAQAEDSCGRRYFLKIYWLKNEGLENVTQNIEDVVVQGFRRESHLPLITSPFLSQILGCYSNREEIKLKEEQHKQQIKLKI